ncbi:hypothetical protein DCS_08232 [Drechmeria coniospora]|uniref:Uncharacterized protein n=1 Tax=Drechmeria coniospora TaxID=98403 RepID=A0A151GGS0_DRECN|nr:hypothetical protein DCS_08232 [Drechmeria coniospora]KYK56262.1 hypothetical protein DCS_08232 [Drechmeria coniospora]
MSQLPRRGHAWKLHLQQMQRQRRGPRDAEFLSVHVPCRRRSSFLSGPAAHRLPSGPRLRRRSKHIMKEGTVVDGPASWHPDTRVLSAVGPLSLSEMAARHCQGWHRRWWLGTWAPGHPGTCVPSAVCCRDFVSVGEASNTLQRIALSRMVRPGTHTLSAVETCLHRRSTKYYTIKDDTVAGGPAPGHPSTYCLLPALSVGTSIGEASNTLQRMALSSMVRPGTHTLSAVETCLHRRTKYYTTKDDTVAVETCSIGERNITPPRTTSSLTVRHPGTRAHIVCCRHFLSGPRLRRKRRQHIGKDGAAADGTAPRHPDTRAGHLGYLGVSSSLVGFG